MRELILIFINLVFAFAAVFFLKVSGYKFTWRLFWISWIISLSGAFSGGVLGVILMARIDVEFGLLISTMPSFLGACLFLGVFVLLRSIPEKW